MKTYILEQEQLLNVTIEKAWEFFSSPENLDELTPDDMGFSITTPRPIPRIKAGQIIEYKVSPILGIPLYWKTEITEVNDKSSFIDNQLKGPYKLWKHTHTFTEVEDKVLMHDRVEYALPLGLIGRLVHSIYVRNKLKDIFDYRYKKIDFIFKNS